MGVATWRYLGVDGRGNLALNAIDLSFDINPPIIDTDDLAVAAHELGEALTALDGDLLTVRVTHVQSLPTRAHCYVAHRAVDLRLESVRQVRDGLHNRLEWIAFYLVKCGEVEQ